MTTAYVATGEALVLGPGEGRAFWFQGNRITIKATGASTGGAFGMVESQLAPGYSPPLPAHEREEETFWVLGGELTIRCGDVTCRATAGACAFLPRGVAH